MMASCFVEAKKDEAFDKIVLYHLFSVGKKAIGDSGYEGMPQKVTITRGKHSPEMKKFLARAKSRQESLHSKLKFFNCLYHKFRHGKNTKEKMELHKMCVEAISVIVQYDMDSGRPVMDL